MDDELRDIWKSAPAPIDIPKVNLEKAKPTLNIIDKIKRIVRFEHWFNIAFTPVAIIYSLVQEFYWSAFLILLFMVPILYYYQNFLNKLNHVQIENGVLDYLKSVEKLLAKFMRHYKILGFTIAIISANIGFFWGLAEGRGQPFDTKIFTKPAFWLGYIFTIVWGFGVIYFMIEWLYAKKIRKLGKHIEELEGEE